MEEGIRAYRGEDENAVVGVWHRAGLDAYTYLPTWQALSLEQARKTIEEQRLSNVVFRQADIFDLPFDENYHSCFHRSHTA